MAYMSTSQTYNKQPADLTRPLDTSSLKGLTAIITGGASGIGLGLSQRLAELGTTVYILDINEDKGNQAANNLKSQGHNVSFIPTDITSWESQQSAFEHVIQNSPTASIDIVITSAGISSRLPTTFPKSTTPSPTKPPTSAFSINLTGTYYTTTLALHYFESPTESQTKDQPKKTKQMLFISSLMAYAEFSVTAYAIDYYASKWGVRGLFRNVRHFAGVKCNLLAPTAVDTPMLAPLVKDRRAQGIKVASVEDCVETAVRCLCDESIDGRAFAITAGEPGKPGSNNFDLEDDFEGSMLWEKFNEGVFGT